jgi:hypothetical protein
MTAPTAHTPQCCSAWCRAGKTTETLSASSALGGVASIVRGDPELISSQVTVAARSTKGREAAKETEAQSAEHCDQHADKHGRGHHAVAPPHGLSSPH